MDNFDALPKSLKKAMRYIRQDANLEQLQEIKILVNKTIDKRKNKLESYIESKKMGER
ncbi:hypothetical protein JF536_02970 [Priestia flexa]|uniref:hypothetical protein n=1 Tax=Priestia flexa TaxID=86664 RepID=UPI001953F9A6|nr:hypothetical protein [Priestia flexa]MBN8433056.1 hypothetical protein [Priestia flexa]MCA0965582.1 hypothetical protein [Priestia flexa]